MTHNVDERLSELDVTGSVTLAVSQASAATATS